MRRYEPKTRYKISSSQLDILLLVLKYRFVSSDILAECLSRDRSTIYERLSVLVDQGYVIKLYDKTYRLRQGPVIYYLAPAGIRYL
ncbi:replication-relaxation family protein, partial [Candidatus Saccharibacteria bacterium]|nr:replication-relaxation family protein [Candidatus Saccharibacteria bacterium]